MNFVCRPIYKVYIMHMQILQIKKLQNVKCFLCQAF